MYRSIILQVFELLVCETASATQKVCVASVVCCVGRVVGDITSIFESDNCQHQPVEMWLSLTHRVTPGVCS